jgi:hypothetical protein
VQFAIQKLLGGFDNLDSPQSSVHFDQTLACLSVRVPLDFNFSHVNTCHLVRRQIECHMLLCVVAISGFELLHTTTSSEPLLAEAAVRVMVQSKNSPIHHLSFHMDNNCINYGERGQLVAALLVMQARDALTSISDSRLVSVGGFMKSLLGTSARIKSALPSFVCDGEGKKSLAKTFKHSHIWFNHILKVHNTDLINVQYLWRFITRGAMILCANSQRGVDLVIPIYYSGNKLSHQTVTAILIQVKNDMRFGENAHGHLFDGMDPFFIKLFDKAPLPIICMVFALASKVPTVKYVPGPSHLHKDEHSFTSYDIWCARIFPETFPFIKSDGPAYRKMLHHTCFPGPGYDMGRTDLCYPEDVLKKKSDLLQLFYHRQDDES